MARRPVVALALALTLFAGACGDDDEDTGTTDTTAAEAPGKGEPVTVEVDAAEDVQDLNLATFAYFPSELTVAAGDTGWSPLSPRAAAALPRSRHLPDARNAGLVDACRRLMTRSSSG